MPSRAAADQHLQTSNCLDESQVACHMRAVLAAGACTLRKSSLAELCVPLQALDYALVNSTPACERFVDVQGLRALFPLFMGKLRVRSAQPGLQKLPCCTAH